jgi:acyl carrier protein
MSQSLDVSLIDGVRKVLADNADLATDVKSLGTVTDLYAAGMTSFASVRVMIALEDTFGITFPDEMLTRELFGTIESLVTAIAELQAKGSPS